MTTSELLKKNAETSIAKTKTEVLSCTVIGINDTKAVEKDGKSYPKVMIVTKEFGNLFAFANQITNRVTCYGEGIKAKLAVLPTKYKDKAGVEVDGYNVVSLTIEVEAMAVVDKIRLASESGATLTF